jgi:hypothetical protein
VAIVHQDPLRGAGSVVRGRAAERAAFCARTGRRVPSSAVNTLFTSFVPAPRRIARSRLARVLVCVLAIALAWANAFAAAMPVGESMPAAPAGSKAPASHAHCADQDMAMPHAKHAGHGADCACGGKACACMHACDALVLAIPSAVAMPVSRGIPLRVANISPSGATPPLRPPIA